MNRLSKTIIPAILACFASCSSDETYTDTNSTDTWSSIGYLKDPFKVNEATVQFYRVDINGTNYLVAKTFRGVAITPEVSGYYYDLTRGCSKPARTQSSDIKTPQTRTIFETKVQRYLSRD